MKVTRGRRTVVLGIFAQEFAVTGASWPARRMFEFVILEVEQF